MQLVVGRVGRPHGIRGEVIVDVRTDDPELRLAAGSVLATEPAAAGPLAIAAARWHSGRLLVRFDGYTDRTAATELSGTLLVVDSAELPDLDDPAEFRDHQLIGLPVITIGGERVGVVTDVLHDGQDLLVVAPEGGRRGADILVPFVAALVPEVDVAAGKIVIDPPQGLLDLADAGQEQ
ncbi:MAG TPA: ribosome maturation factor RimM [Streptosporangiaceae bacterium]|nr:ribosome maturation factor RimM [Streptosporangiaceae bacterium]